jgi:hypothetical protein
LTAAQKREAEVKKRREAKEREKKRQHEMLTSQATAGTIMAGKAPGVVLKAMKRKTKIRSEAVAQADKLYRSESRFFDDDEEIQDSAPPIKSLI